MADGGREGLAVRLGEVEVRVVGEEVSSVRDVVPRRGESRGLVKQSLTQELLLLLQDQATGALPR